MTLLEAITIHVGALRIDAIMSRAARLWLRRSVVLLTVVSILYGVVAKIYGLPWADISTGLAFILAALYVVLWMLEAYYNTYYFYGLNSIIGLDERKVTGCSYDVASMAGARGHDLTAAFLHSDIGIETLMRLGVTQSDIDTFLVSARTPLDARSIVIPELAILRMETYGLYLLQRDTAFETFLNQRGVQNEQFMGALRWVAGRVREAKRRQRWWSKDNLSRTQSLGREWTYGKTYALEKFSKDMRSSTVFSGVAENTAYATEKVEEIEATLARQLSANVLLVGEAGVGKMDLLMAVSRRMALGTALQAVAGKHMVVLDTARLFASFSNKQEIEDSIIALFDEAEAAGNIIIVIENISSFINELTIIGINLPEVIDRFLASTQLHIIATDTPSGYHTYLEPLHGFTRRFQEILVDTPSVESTVRVLAPLAEAAEQKGGPLFTYQSLNAIAMAAERYIVTGVMPDKAVQLLADVNSYCIECGRRFVTADVVYQVVSEKTGIPAGPIQDSEKELLLGLEDVLHKKVIGQHQAIVAIARTMRRARAGIQASDRPIGSFLFLGPTGVGKTETAKALASVFFKDEAAINRLDMSEFSDESGAQRLLGDQATAGVLSAMLHERPYCVLLLDEFEKASTDVHDLFLQILDEGVFTDGRGARINVRNAIIIATSNAGSTLIMQTVQQRKDVSKLNTEIINHIINQGIFTPELINRFDSTIIFEPLEAHEQGAVASLMLNDLVTRVRQQGYALEVTDALLQALVAKGYSREFGARPMRRLLQDLVEEKVAEKIISGALDKGGTVRLDVSDFTDEELVVA